jgi:hypothetical protein
MNDFIDDLRKEQTQAEKNAGTGNILRVRKDRPSNLNYDPKNKKQLKRIEFDADFGDGDINDTMTVGASSVEEMEENALAAEEKKAQISRLAELFKGYAQQFEQEIDKGFETAEEKRKKAAIERQKAA